MKTNRRESIGFSPDFSFSESDPHPGAELLQVSKDLEKDLRSWTCNALSHTIFLLSFIADDERVCVQNPGLVREAFQNHAHLLCQHEATMLQDWFLQLSQPRQQENAAAH